MLTTAASWLQDEEDDMKGATGRGPAYRRRLAGKTVSVVGLAKSGVAAARLIRRVGGTVLASDAADRAALSAEALRLERDGCAFWTGGHPDEAFADAELVVVSPGVPLTLPALVRVRARGVPIVGELELAWRAMEAEVIAITGTNGKTTTTALTGELLRAQVRPVLVGGNIGTPLSDQALDFPADGIVVAESSSFQLESTALFRPRVAAVLNITPDHLDRHGSLERYVEAKARILANQTEADCAVLNADDPGAAALAARVRGRVLWFSRLRRDIVGVFIDEGWIVARLNGHVERICPVTDLALRGAHNVENVLAATACVLWRRSPDRARPRGRGCRVLQRLQGHQRRLHHQGARELHGARGADRGRQGEGPGFRAPHPGGARARAPRRPDRGGPRAAPRSAGAGRRRRRGRRVHGGGGAGGARGGPAGRRRAAVARLRLLRHVRQLRASRRRL
jgi:UDP-N-acetylmuramoylalanine--D-glutamate ligase